MSSMRNAVQRRNHKERAQPTERQKWGLLEKHKDYSLRAADHKSKQKRLKILKEKARDRNPDEFSFKMMSTNSVGGRKVADRGNQSLSMEVVKLLKTQDAGYLRTKLQTVRKERQKVEEEVAEREVAGEKKGKVIYVNDVEKQREFGQDDGDDDEWEGVSDDGNDKKARHAAKRKEAFAEGQRKRLEHLERVEEQLSTAERELELQRARMSGSIGGVNKNGVKFKVRQRKR